jgi:hypothetical protein
MKKLSDLSIQTAATAWCQDTTSHIEMDVELATAFAEIIEDIWSKPWLGNATTKELLDELNARCGDLNYKTVENK